MFRLPEMAVDVIEETLALTSGWPASVKSTVAPARKLVPDKVKETGLVVAESGVMVSMDGPEGAEPDKIREYG